MAKGKIAREKDTIEKMIVLYCKDKHNTLGKVCADCQELLEYAMQRLSRCKFGENKPVCGNCTVHCYKKDMRMRVIEVMRYAGPRMIFKHPIAALYHLFDSKKKPSVPE